MNNGVNNSNNLNNQNSMEQPVLQPLQNNNVVPTQPASPVMQPVMQTPVVNTAQPVVNAASVVEQNVTTPVQPEVQTAVVPSENKEEEETVVQNIPGVIVAPPQHGGMDKPNPIQPLPGTEVETEPVTEAVQEVVTEPVQEDNDKKKKKKNKLARFYFLIILILIGVIVYFNYAHSMEVAMLNEKCTPVSTSGKAKELDLDSTIVQDLYAKVKTSLREDLASTELNDQMKLYLAYRQLAYSEFYESNCNLFSSTAMEPFVCQESAVISPMAFKEEDLQREVKKLFGDDVEIANANIQLGTGTCIGGYQYIAERGEYVQGVCTQNTATTFKMDKELVKAESKESVITLYEEVKYYNAEGLDLPERLKSGTYVYTFKLDMKYDYIYVSKELQEK